MEIDPKQIAKMITEDPDEVNPLDNIEDEFEPPWLPHTLNHYNIEVEYIAAGHGELAQLIFGDDESRRQRGDEDNNEYITTTDDPKNEHWGIEDTYQQQTAGSYDEGDDEWVIVVKGTDDTYAWYDEFGGWVAGEPESDINNP